MNLSCHHWLRKGQFITPLRLFIICAVYIDVMYYNIASSHTSYPVVKQNYELDGRMLVRFHTRFYSLKHDGALNGAI